MGSSARILKFRNDVKHFFNYGLKSVSAHYLINQHISLDGSYLVIRSISGGQKSFNISSFKRISLIGAGKASAVMGEALENIFGNVFNDSCILTKYGFSRKLKYYQCTEAGHPLPDKNGLLGSQKIIEICQNAGDGDLVINLLSGGASSLLISPAEGITLEDKIRTANLLLNAGADIFELNTVRKHLSCIKGGNLARQAFSATIINLVISDVIGDDLSVIGSGPFSPDSSTFSDCLRIFNKYSLFNEMPDNVKFRIINGTSHKIEETPKGGEKFFSDIHNFIIGNNSIALNKIKTEAERIGYEAEIITQDLQGEAKATGKQIVQKIFTREKPALNQYKPKCFIFGGETYVKVKGTGKGGRNQELALAAALECQGEHDFLLLSGGTDGNDGPTDSAGAICDNHTISRANQLNINAESMLEENDSYNFFKPLGDLLITGPTSTNVMDIQIVITD